MLVDGSCTVKVKTGPGPETTDDCGPLGRPLDARVTSRTAPAMLSLALAVTESVSPKTVVFSKPTAGAVSETVGGTASVKMMVAPSKTPTCTCTAGESVDWLCVSQPRATSRLSLPTRSASAV